MSTALHVRGQASAEELAAVLAALARSGPDGHGTAAARTGLAGWRDGRVAALRRHAERGAGPG